MSGRVRIGTCADPADAALIRSVFAARGIGVVIGAEHHASLLGPIGSSFLSLDIWVASDDAEDAVALLRDVREGGPAGDAETEAAAEATLADEDDRPDPRSGPSEEDAAAEDAEVRAEWTARVAIRQRTVLTILFGCFVTLGAAHLFVGAWARGLVLAAIELVGIRYLMHNNDGMGIAVILAAVIADVIGALWLLRDQRALPTARVHRR